MKTLLNDYEPSDRKRKEHELHKLEQKGMQTQEYQGQLYQIYRWETK